MRAGARAEAKLAGQIRYVTGRACKHGHVSERYTKSGKCAACCDISVRKFEKRIPHLIRARTRKYYLKRKHKITPQQYDEMLQEQHGACAICKSTNPFDRWSRFHIDHDHETGVIRGLLCSKCNVALGQFDDDVARLQAAAIYLTKGKR